MIGYLASVVGCRVLHLAQLPGHEGLIIARREV